jgi:hypothetical protein
MTLSITQHFIYFYVECHYAECRYAECRYAECRYAECRGAEIIALLAEFKKKSKAKYFSSACY